MTTTALIIHAVMYRNYQLGTLCDSGAFGLPEHFTAITEKVTCPACRDKLDGGATSERQRVLDSDFLDAVTRAEQAEANLAEMRSQRDDAREALRMERENRDHIAAQLDAVRELHEGWAETPLSDLNAGTLWDRLGRILKGLS